QSKDGERRWTAAAIRFAKKFIATIVALDKALRSTAQVTPEPDWASDPSFALTMERDLKARLLDAERAVEAAQRKKEQIVEELTSVGSYRGLLYEKGKALEAVIVEALKVLGFTARPYKDARSEFDIVFESADGRLIGEAEGK